MVFIFVICAMLGWLVEVCYVYLVNGKLVDRGMLYGPFCTIYGFGSLILYLLFYNLKPTKLNIPYAFFTSAICMGAFELICGLFFKHILHIEMWNYQGRFLEILNYTTVPIMIGWGVLGTVYVFWIQPVLQKLIVLVPKHFSKRLALLLIVFYFLNFCLSTLRIFYHPDILYRLVHP